MSVPGQTSRSRALHVTKHSSHHVYRCYDAAGVLLYVGCTSDLRKRMTSHNRGDGRTASRWLSVTMARHEVDGPYSNKDAGLAAEAEAIRQERPVFNLQGGGVPVWMHKRDVAQYLVAHGHIDLAIETCCTCWPEVREANAYDDSCIAHAAKPGDLSPFDWDAYEAEAERELQEWDAVAAAVAFKGGAA